MSRTGPDGVLPEALDLASLALYRFKTNRMASDLGFISSTVAARFGSGTRSPRWHSSTI